MPTLTPVTRWGGVGPDFDKVAAERAYTEIMKCDAAAAPVLARMILADVQHHELLAHRDEIAKAYFAVAKARRIQLTRQLARSAVAKARAGEDTEPLLQALVALSKAAPELDADDRRELSENAQRQHRDPGTGRFVQEHVRIDPTRAPSKMQERRGSRVPDGFKDLSGAQKVAYRNAYHQVADLIAPYQNLPGNATLHLVYDSGASSAHPIPGRGRQLSGDVIKPEMGSVRSAAVSVVPGLDAPGAYFDALSAVAGPRAGAVGAGAVQGGALDPGRLNRYHREITERSDGDQFTPSTRFFRHLNSGASLIDDTLGPAAPPQAKLALAVAQHVGAMGPTAQKIVGPTVDRAAYRYRGTERRPDSKLTAALGNNSRLAAERSPLAAEAMRSDRQADADLQGRVGMASASERERHQQVRRDWARTEAEHRAGRISGKERKQRAKAYQAEMKAATRRRQDVERRAAGEHKQAKAAAAEQLRRAGTQRQQVTSSLALRGFTSESTGRWNEGPVLAYMHSRVPSPELAQLQLKSGTVPPSEGIILDAKGNLVTQAVGYGDDHYLPFNLRSLSKLRGGQYIRTRTYGGPTTEDVYTGLMSGSKSMSVVSNNGVFNVEFDPSFKGGRRYNDKAARMVARYGHLLDAVKHGNVTTGDIDPTRQAELKDEARRLFPDEGDGYERELARLETSERRNPKLSQPQRAAAATEWLRGQAARVSSADGREISTEQYVDQLVDRQARAELSQHLRSTPGAAEDPAVQNLDYWRSRARAQLSDPDPVRAAEKVAEASGKKGGFDAYMAETQNQYRNSLRELSLNGPGYEAALRGLQEQFPYYIRSVSYRPWREGADPAGRAGRPYAPDTGYVKPRHNRPQAALAGYYDADVAGDTGRGTGKATADSIRNQNYAVRHGRLRPVGSGRPDVERAREGGRGAGGNAAREPSEADKRDLQTRADRAMLNELLDKTTFGPDAAVNGTSLSGRKIRELASGGEFPDPLAFLYRRPAADVKREFEDDPAAMHDRLAAAHEEVKSNRWFGVNPTVAQKFEGGGRTQARDGSNVEAMLRNPNAEYAFGDRGAAFVGSPTQAAVEAAYAADPQVRALTRAGRLPADVGAEDFRSHADALQSALEQQDERIADWKAGGRVGSPPAREEEHAAQVRGLAGANQLRRRHDEARGREDAAAKAEADRRRAEEPDISETNQLYLPPPADGQSPEDYGTYLAAAQAAMQRERDDMRRGGDRTIDA